MAEKMISLGKKGDLSSKRAISAYLYSKEAAIKLVEDIAPRYADRNGGYTRVIRTGRRRGDASDMAILELV